MTDEIAEDEAKLKQQRKITTSQSRDLYLVDIWSLVVENTATMIMAN